MNCLLSENYCSTTWHQVIKLHQEFLVYYKTLSVNTLRDLIQHWNQRKY